MDVLGGAPILLWECRPVWIVEAHGTLEPLTPLFELAGYEVTLTGKGVEVAPQLPVGGPARLVARPRSYHLS